MRRRTTTALAALVMVVAACGAQAEETAQFEVEPAPETANGASQAGDAAATPSSVAGSEASDIDDDGTAPSAEKGNDATDDSDQELAQLGDLPAGYDVPQVGEVFDAFTQPDLLPADAQIVEAILSASTDEQGAPGPVDVTIHFVSETEHAALADRLQVTLEAAGWETGKVPETTTSSDGTVATWGTFRPPAGTDFENFFLRSEPGGPTTGEYHIPELDTSAEPPFYGTHGEQWFGGLPLPGFDIAGEWSFQASIADAGLTAHRVTLEWEVAEATPETLFTATRAAFPTGDFVVLEDRLRVPDDPAGGWFLPIGNQPADLNGEWQFRQIDDGVVMVQASLFALDL